MIDKRVALMWADAKSAEYKDAFVSDWALSSVWGDDIAPDEARAEYAEKIWDAVHLPLKDLVKHTGLSQAAFAARYCIAGSTVEAWCRGIRTPPDYVKLLLSLDVGLLE